MMGKGMGGGNQGGGQQSTGDPGSGGPGGTFGSSSGGWGANTYPYQGGMFGSNPYQKSLLNQYGSNY